MPAWLSRLLWMALQSAIVVGFLAFEYHRAREDGDAEQYGFAFLFGCGAAIIVTTLLTKAWDLSRAAVARLRGAHRPLAFREGDEARREQLDVRTPGPRPGERP